MSTDKNPNLERLLEEINSIISSTGPCMQPAVKSEYPLVILVGAPRSGTTLFMQWLSSTGLAATPSNFVSRFYKSPVLGLKIQRMLFDHEYQYLDEMRMNSEQSPNFKSYYGKTIGPLAPNSFFYFWRRFFPLAGSQKLSQSQINSSDFDAFRDSINQLISEYQQPLAMKGYLVQYDIEKVVSILNKAVVIHLTRDPVSTVHSLLKARTDIYGDESKWWGCRPPGSESLDNEHPYVQVAGQVLLTEQAIKNEMAKLDPCDHLTLSYEDLCKSPQDCYSSIKNLIESKCNNTISFPEKLDNHFSFNASISKDTSSKKKLELAISRLQELALI